MAAKRQLLTEKKNSKKARTLDENLVNAVNDSKSGTKQPKAKRTRRFCLTTYIDDSALYGYLNGLQWVQHWAYITHDKDVKDDGELKEKHTHVLLYTYEAKTVTAIKKNFDNFSAEYYAMRSAEAQNTMAQECNDISAQWRYLRHLDDKNKAQYDIQDVVCDDLSYWNTLDKYNGLTDSVGNAGLSILDDYMNGTDCYTMAQRYGKEWIYHISHYQNAVRLMACEQSKHTFGGLADICRFALADSTYSEEQITLFFGMLSYIQNKMDSKTEFTLESKRYLIRITKKWKL